MAGNFTKSWSFFGPRRPRSDEYLGQHYQPGTPSSRINLQQRFGDQGVQNRPWRRGPLPPPPTRPNGHSSSVYDRLGERQIPRFASFDFNRLGGIHSHYANVEECKPTSDGNIKDGKSPRASTLPRRPLRDLSFLNSLQDNVSQLKPQTSKLLQESGKKMNRAIQGVRTSLSSFTQLFRSSTRRRYKLDGGTPTRTPRRTPNHPQRQTPGKLYSPFDVSTPRTPHSYHRGPKRLQGATPRRVYGSQNSALTRTPQHPPRAPPDAYQWTQFHSPSQKFGHDVVSARQGINDFHHVGNSIVSSAPGRWAQFR
ncbi:uncharacterized protein [Macrobrachium rosenbergii]|uniref:uncharacterized protein n=1 Tax=Macrobrachium rosenbergii TaxID=79674 RepID=UPI0034D56640